MFKGVQGERYNMKVVTLKLMDAIKLKDAFVNDKYRDNVLHRERVIRYIMRKYDLTKDEVLACVEKMCSGRIVVYE